MTDGVMHLVEPRGAGCGPCTLGFVAQHAEREQSRIVVLGSRADAQLAVDSGCHVERSLPIPLGMPRLLGSALRRAWGDVKESRVVAWSERAAAAATLLPAEVRCTANIASVFGATPWVEPWRRSRVEVAGFGRGMGRLLAERQWRSGPGLEVASLGMPAQREHSQRERIRAEWGAQDDEFVIACVTDPPEATDLSAIFNAVNVASICGHRIRLIAHPGCRSAGQVARQAKHLEQNPELPDVPLRFDERLIAPWLVADGVDCLIARPRPSRSHLERASLLTLPWWMSAGVMVVSSGLIGAEEVIADGEDGVILDGADRNALAAQIMRYCDDRAAMSPFQQAAKSRWQLGRHQDAQLLSQAGS